MIVKKLQDHQRGYDVYVDINHVIAFGETTSNEKNKPEDGCCVVFMAGKNKELINTSFEDFQKIMLHHGFLFQTFTWLNDVESKIAIKQNESFNINRPFKDGKHLNCILMTSLDGAFDIKESPEEILTAFNYQLT